ncbi:HNH endonuclease [Anaerosalibacter sp. Marseille-P3206]|uniref:HNH endonuclease n=1 Tax=Anaerosalibacter sp. Marseille-P3206 TaxID=1871005 RepID=UPI00098632D8|nr:HNH endonuclease [Anaerosalibacter sp. Marseille-P3206]
MNNIIINERRFDIIDTVECITIADSFVKINKIGTGHGEAKLYVGNYNDRLVEFWGDFSDRCFFLKSDFEKFLTDSKDEYLFPQQEYSNKDVMPKVYEKLREKISNLENDFLEFNIYRSDVALPRVYINSDSDYYTLMREVGIPNISYVSILKLKNNNKIYYYFKLFIDYKSDIVKFYRPRERDQENLIVKNDKISKRSKERLISSRVGQGEYRTKLLNECLFCPFTLVNDERLLIASHIKPWADSNDREKVDPKNGFILTPTYDTLFDRGFITFENNKKLMVSPWISPMNQNRLQIYTGKTISKLPLDEKRIVYLEYHRKNVFKG